jgi:phosphoribosylformylglycinamidine cyclo-ligase
VGLVPANRLVVGEDIVDGDVVVGLASNGVHSNGYTLARRVFFEELGYDVDTHVPELGHTVGEELLRPTAIYVRPAMAMLRAGLQVRAFSHMTSDGLLNLLRVRARTGYVIDCLPPPGPVFDLIQQGGNVADEEMFLVYNMGIGFGVVVAPEDADRVRQIAGEHGFDSWVLGRADSSEVGKVVVEPRGLVGEDDFFHKR